MSGSTALTCSRCGAPTPYRAPCCGFCGERLVWPGKIDLLVGDPITALVCPRDRLPGWPDGDQATQDGPAVIDNGANRIYWGNAPTRICDACVAVTGRCLDVNGELGVVARYVSEGEAYSGYVAYLRAGTRSVILHRMFGSTKLFTDPLCGWEVSGAVARVGELNRLELRCADSLIEVHVNGRMVTSVIDARFGYGKFGWYTGASTDGPSRIQIERFDLAHVG